MANINNKMHNNKRRLILRPLLRRLESIPELRPYVPFAPNARFILKPTSNSKSNIKQRRIPPLHNLNMDDEEIRNNFINNALSRSTRERINNNKSVEHIEDQSLNDYHMFNLHQYIQSVSNDLAQNSNPPPALLPALNQLPNNVNHLQQTHNNNQLSHQSKPQHISVNQRNIILERQRSNLINKENTQAELKAFINYFSVADFKEILSIVGGNKTGKKKILQERVVGLISADLEVVNKKIKEMYYSKLQISTVNTVSTDTIPRPPLATSNQNGEPGPIKQSQPTYVVYADLRFKKLAFYDIILELFKPTTLIPQHNVINQHMGLSIVLSAQQISEIRSSYNPETKQYFKQIQLRFCLVQAPAHEQEDYLPVHLSVKVNNTVFPMPNIVPPNFKKSNELQRSAAQPLNLTPFLNLDPDPKNMLQIYWKVSPQRYNYGITLVVVEKRTPEELLQRLTPRSALCTKTLIRLKLREDADSEIATTSLCVSLLCPLGKTRIVIPCKANLCQHLQCFDGTSFLKMNELTPTWICPICQKSCTYNEMIIDSYFQEILQSPNLPPDVTEIQLHRNGTWTIQSELSIADAQEVNDSIEIMDEVEQEATVSSTSTKPNGMNFVDLTISDYENQIAMENLERDLNMRNNERPFEMLFE